MGTLPAAEPFAQQPSPQPSISPVPTEILARNPKPGSERRLERDRTDQSELTPIPCQDGPMPWATHLLALLNALLADRSRLAFENVALRQQIVVLKRSVERAKINDSDRIFWILMRRLLDGWRDTLLIVKPDTVIKWHRKGWNYFWRRKSMLGKPGRPPIDSEVIKLIRRMSRENITWGAPRIQSELALLGHVVAKSTVAKYMPRSTAGCSRRRSR